MPPLNPTFSRASPGPARRAGGTDRASIHASLLFGLFVVAAALRIWFFTTSAVVNPIRGDAAEYFHYAINLVHHGVFSKSTGSDLLPPPDSFRDPGYPLLLALIMAGLGDGPSWYIAVLAVQSLLGSASCVLLVLLASRWLPSAWALSAGLLCAFWPHSISICGFLVSETLFGFSVLLALLLFARACESRRRREWWLAGLAFGLSALVNATIAPFFPLLALGMFAMRSRPRNLVIGALVMSLLLPAAWQMRSRMVDGGRGARDRVLVNLVQGGWPDYHSAYQAAVNQDPDGAATMQAIEAEQSRMLASVTGGLDSMRDRFAGNPRRYALWYFEKPWELWGWSIQMGYGDIYVYQILHPIFLVNPVMRLAEAVCFALNPLLFFAMVLTVVWIFLGGGRRLGSAPVPMAVSALLAFETLVYAILQSEPRYSVPFRPLQLALFVTAVFILADWRRRAGEPGVAVSISPPGTLP